MKGEGDTGKSLPGKVNKQMQAPVGRKGLGVFEKGHHVRNVVRERESGAG